jgi:hypothetical protein
MPGDTRHVDDDAAALLAHDGQFEFHGIENTIEIGRDQIAVLLDTQILEFERRPRRQHC